MVVSAGDSGSQGTFDIQSDDPAVIGAAGTDSLRLIATDDGYSKYVSNNISALSSGRHRPDEQARRPGRAVLVRRRGGVR